MIFAVLGTMRIHYFGSDGEISWRFIWCSRIIASGAVPRDNVLSDLVINNRSLAEGSVRGRTGICNEGTEVLRHEKFIAVNDRDFGSLYACSHQLC